MLGDVKTVAAWGERKFIVKFVKVRKEMLDIVVEDQTEKLTFWSAATAKTLLLFKINENFYV